MCFKPFVKVKDLGLMSYADAWAYQQRVLQSLITSKRDKLNLATDNRSKQQHQLLFCEHPPVFTLGKSGNQSNLLLTQELLQAKGIEFFKINRGGDITFHGPGQVVGYPIFDLDEFFTDVHRYVRSIEQAVIDTLADYHLGAIRMPGYTGVWLPATTIKPCRKICAIGVHLSRWVTMHGFAFNVNTDLSYFRHIVPCGISDPNMEVTSLSKELKEEVSMLQVKERLVHHFAAIFDFEY